MKLLQFYRRQPERQRTRVPHLKTVTEKHDLNTAITGIVAVCHGIDDGLCDSFNGNLVFHLSGSRTMSGRDMGINVRQDKSDGLVNHLKNAPVKDLIRKDGFGHYVGGEPAHFTSEVMKNFCGSLANSKRAALVSSPDSEVRLR